MVVMLILYNYYLMLFLIDLLICLLLLGWVHNGRVNSALGVSRSLGDIQYKLYDETIRKPANISADNDMGGLWVNKLNIIYLISLIYLFGCNVF